MKRVTEPGAIVLYEGELARVIAIATGRTITLELIEKEPCPTCGELRRVQLLEHSPLFQERVQPVETVAT